MISRYYEIIAVLFTKELKVSYKHNILGYLWSIANPLAHAILFYFVFELVAKIQMENFALFLVTGLFPWQSISNSIVSAPGLLIGNRELIKKVAFPSVLINISSVLQIMFHYILSLPIIFVFVLLFNQQLSFWYILGIPILCVLHFLLCLSINVICSSLNVFFRDLERLAQVVVLFLFYFTPVVYSMDMVPDKYVYLINLNPISPMITSWRKLFLEHDINNQYLYFSIFWVLILCSFAYFIYKKLSWRFAESL